MAAFHHALLQDGSLRLEAAAELSFAVDPWLPWNLPPEPIPSPRRAAVIDVRQSVEQPDPGDGPPMLRLGSVSARQSGPDSILLHADDLSAWGRLDLSSLRAELRAQRAAPGRGIELPDASAEDRNGRHRDDVGRGVFSMLTLASAFLLGHLGRTLLHAGAVIAPDGRAWLLVGDTHSGKTTSVLTLIQAGWPFLSDDHVVVQSGEGGAIHAEGWARTFHVDEGWPDGAVTGRREDLPLERLPDATFQRMGPVAGVLFPEVHPAQPTRSTPAAPGAALQRIIRQSPWLLADRGVAPELLALLRRLAVLPGFDLTLGRDSYGDPARLIAALPDPLRSGSPVDA